MEFRGLTLDPFQQQAIEHVDADCSVLVSAPTGTGKTLIADYIVEKALSENKEVIYTAPIKALVSEKFFALCDEFGAENVFDAIGSSVHMGSRQVGVPDEVEFPESVVSGPVSGKQMTPVGQSPGVGVAADDFAPFSGSIQKML